MKSHDLLDAIGGIDESLLIEAEAPPATGRKLARRILLAAAVICALTATAAATTGLFSRPIQDSEIVTGETVFPFVMDKEGNIVMEGQSGLKVTMDVDVNPDAPDWIEELYVLEPGDGWSYHGGGSSGSRYFFSTHFTVWRQEDKPGEIRLDQSVVDFYVRDTYGENCVDTLAKLSEKDGVTSKTVIVGGIEALKVSIPALPNYEGTDYCTGGETRLYWTDGNYILHLDYPYWVTDSQAEAMLKSLTVQDYVAPVPEDFGKINPQSIAQRLPDLSIGTDNGTSCANNTAGLGYSAYGDGYIYWVGLENAIYRYELATGQVKKMPFASQRVVGGHIFVTDQYVLYTDVYSDLFAMKKDGSTEEPVFQGLHCSQLYAEGTTLYTSGGILDLYTGDVMHWPEGVHSYYVDDTYIYAVQTGGEFSYLRAPKGTMAFEKIPVGFYPVKVFSYGDSLFFSEGSTWNVIRIRDGKEERLPIYALEYQVLGDLLIYRDEEASGRSLKSYNLETGEVRELCDKVFTFSILEDRYISVFCAEGTESYFTLIDMETGSVTQVDPEKAN